MNEKEIAVPNLLEESGIEKMILVIRGKQVLLDRDLAALYGVETRAINQAVKRNIERFPDRYCFQLEKSELDNLKSQNVISSWGGDRFKPYAFTEKGLCMLATILKSKTATNTNFAILADKIFDSLNHKFMTACLGKAKEGRGF